VYVVVNVIASLRKYTFPFTEHVLSIIIIQCPCEGCCNHCIFRL